jgi:chromosome segregation ATPase
VSILVGGHTNREGGHIMANNEHESSQGVILARLEERFSQLLDIVTEIKNNLHNQTVKMGEINTKLTKLELSDAQNKKDIEKLNAKHDSNRKMLLGIASTILGGVALAVIKYFMGI